MPRFELIDEEPAGGGGESSDSENENEPPHPLGFAGVLDPSSPWGTTWISLDPPSRSKYTTNTNTNTNNTTAVQGGRSTYGFDEEEDLFVQSFPPLSAYLSSKHVPTSALLEFSNGDPAVRSQQHQQQKQKQQQPYRQRRRRPNTDDDLYYSSAEDDDNDNHNDDNRYNNNHDYRYNNNNHNYENNNYPAQKSIGSDEHNNNDVELLFQISASNNNNNHHNTPSTSIPLLLTGLQLQTELSLLASPKEIRDKRDETNRTIQRKVEAERRRIDDECERTAAILGELVLQSNRDANVILQQEKAEAEKIARARSAREDYQRKLHETAEREAALRQERADQQAVQHQQAAQKQRQEQQAQETTAAKQKHDAETRAKKKTEHIDKAKKLVGQLVQVRASVEPFETNKAHGKRRLGMKKIAKGKVNTLNDNPQKIKEVAMEISRAITLYDQEDAHIKQQLKQKVPGLTPDMALGRRYFVDLLASTAMMRVQAESFCGTKGDGFPLAAMLAMLAVEHKNIMAVLAAHIYTVCPTAIPAMPSPGPDATEEEVMTSLGMQRHKKTGDFESFPQFLARTENIVSVVAAIQSSLPSSHQLLAGNTGALLWLKRFLELLPPAPAAPLPLTTAPVLGAFLAGAGHMLANVHPDRFRKLLGYIESDVVKRIDQGAVGKPSAIRLAKVLEGGFDAFATNLPPKAIPECYYGASDHSKQTPAAVTSFSGTIGGEETVKPKRTLAPPKSKNSNSNRDSGAFGGRSSYNNNNHNNNHNNNNNNHNNNNHNNNAQSSPFGGNSTPSQSQSPFGGGSQTPTPAPFGGSASPGFGQGSSPSPFGGTTAPMQSTQQAPQQAQAQSSPFGSFASSSNNTAANPSPFGNGGMAPASTPFGGSGAAQSPSPFGATTAAQSPSPFGASSQSPFGGATNNGAMQQNSPFGGSNNAMQQQISSYGGSTNDMQQHSNSSFGGGGNNNHHQQNQTNGGGGRKKGPCKFFVQGRCRKGANCEFSHETGGGSGGGGGGGGFGNQGNAVFGSNNNNNNSGRNNNSNNNYNSNDNNNNNNNSGRNNQGFGSNNSNSNNNRGGNKKGPCKFFAQGRCTKGKNCPFSHDSGGGGFGGGNNNSNNNSNNQGFSSNNNWN